MIHRPCSRPSREGRARHSVRAVFKLRTPGAQRTDAPYRDQCFTHSLIPALTSLAPLARPLRAFGFAEFLSRFPKPLKFPQKEKENRSPSHRNSRAGSCQEAIHKAETVCRQRASGILPEDQSEVLEMVSSAGKTPAAL